MVDELSCPPSPSSYSICSTTSTDSEYSLTDDLDDQCSSVWVDDTEDIECIELTDDQPTHNHQPQELVIDNVPTLKKKLKMDKKKTKKEKKEERKKKKEAKKAAKIEKKRQIAEDKQWARNFKILTKEYEKYKKKKAREMAQAMSATKVVKQKKRVTWATPLAEYKYFEKQEMPEHDVKRSEHDEAEENRRAWIISQMETSIADFEVKIEKLEEKNLQRWDDLCRLEDKRSKITCFEDENPSSVNEDYNLQFKIQGLKKDIALTTRTINRLKTAIVNKHNIIERMMSYSDQVTSDMSVNTSNTEPTACDKTFPGEDSHSSIPSHVIVVKEYCPESSSLTSLPKFTPNNVCLTGTPNSTQ